MQAYVPEKPASVACLSLLPIAALIFHKHTVARSLFLYISSCALPPFPLIYSSSLPFLLIMIPEHIYSEVHDAAKKAKEEAYRRMMQRFSGVGTAATNDDDGDDDDDDDDDDGGSASPVSSSSLSSSQSFPGHCKTDGGGNCGGGSRLRLRLLARIESAHGGWVTAMTMLPGGWARARVRGRAHEWVGARTSV